MIWRDYSVWRTAGMAILLSGMAHALCLIYSPAPFAFDAFQRWGGRDHLLVQSWLPLGQSLLWLMADLGPLWARGLYSVVGTAVAGLMVLLAGRIGGRRAAEFTLAAATFGPFTTWTSTFYLEGPFLFVLLSGLLLALDRRFLVADLVIGLLGLCRYEGWPFLVVYCLWRRDPASLRAMWGVALWLVIRLGLKIEGFHASPIDYDDWEGLARRFSAMSFLQDLVSFFVMASYHSALAWLIGGAVGAALAWRRLPAERPQIALLVALLLGQGATTMFWMAGLEGPISRMTIIPTLLSAVLTGVGLATIHDQLPRWLQRLIPVTRVLLLALGIDYIDGALMHEIREVEPELAAVERVEGCPDCRWWIEPRAGLGTRDRHDGCEVIQGLTRLRHGVDFYCGPWVEKEERERLKGQMDAVLIWNGRRYQNR